MPEKPANEGYVITFDRFRNLLAELALVGFVIGFIEGM